MRNPCISSAVVDGEAVAMRSTAAGALRYGKAPGPEGEQLKLHKALFGSVPVHSGWQRKPLAV